VAACGDGGEVGSVPREAGCPEVEIFVRLGVQVPTIGDLPRSIGVVRMGRHAEDAGADSLWVNDHVLMVEGALDGGRSSYPFSEDGVPWWSADMPWYECLTAASFLAATTRGCEVGTSVLVLPQRNVLELAKTTATLDALSRGRLVLGVGVGWFAEEVEALGYRFETRGKRTDEMLEALRGCWTGRPPAFEGDEVRVPEGLVFEPRPSRPGGPPILIGGMSRAALRRAAKRGDGWMAFQRDGLDADRMGELLRSLRELRVEVGRPGEPFRNVLRLRGSPEMAPRLPALATQAKELGFDELIIDPPWDSLGETEESIASVREAVGATDAGRDPARE
jgi:probable F420-dependent oxidoreductase